MLAVAINDSQVYFYLGKQSYLVLAVAINDLRSVGSIQLQMVVCILLRFKCFIKF